MKFNLILILFLLLATGISGQLDAQSLWEKRDNRKSFLFQDLKARQVGDILTISIRESTDVDNADSRGLSKQTSADANGGISWAGNTSGSVSTSLTADSDRQFDGDTNFTSERDFMDQFSVTVIDRLPNGNLVVSGSRDIVVEGDRRQLVLSGIVREFDILANNSVSSRNVAQLRIQYTGQGAESAFVNQGWIGRRFNRLWPF